MKGQDFVVVERHFDDGHVEIVVSTASGAEKVAVFEVSRLDGSTHVFSVDASARVSHQWDGSPVRGSVDMQSHRLVANLPDTPS